LLVFETLQRAVIDNKIQTINKASDILF